MRILVWQWGRFGAGPRVAVDFAALFNTLPGTDAVLSLAARAEILQGQHRPRCELPVPTYASIPGFAARVLGTPILVPWLARQIRALQPDVALCAMPGPLDLAMHAALRRAKTPYAVVAHDADLHPGDGYPMQMTLQRQLLRRADAIVVLSDHVRDRLAELGLTHKKPVFRASLPPYTLAEAPPPPNTHGGKLRILCFGRLLPYKGLDLLAESLTLLLPRPDVDIRIVGNGPESPALATLRGLPGVSVENRWVPEDEVGALITWSDVMLLTYIEASQSAVAAAALAAGRWIVSTRVGGITEQLQDSPLARLCGTTPPEVADAIRTLFSNPPPTTSTTPTQFWMQDATSLAAELKTLTHQRTTRPQTMPPRSKKA